MLMAAVVKRMLQLLQTAAACRTGPKSSLKKLTREQHMQQQGVVIPSAAAVAVLPCTAPLSKQGHTPVRQCSAAGATNELTKLSWSIAAGGRVGGWTQARLLQLLAPS
jgi:hypothetical protein